MFAVDQDVICVDDSGFSLLQRAKANLPKAWQVYRIRSFSSDGAARLYGLSNAGFYNPNLPSGEEPGFDCRRFRPLEESDISVFKRMLVDRHEAVDA